MVLNIETTNGGSYTTSINTISTNSSIEPSDIMRYLHESDSFDRTLVFAYLNKVPSSVGLEKHGKRLIRVDVVLDLLETHSKEEVIQFLKSIIQDESGHNS